MSSSQDFADVFDGKITDMPSDSFSSQNHFEIEPFQISSQENYSQESYSLSDVHATAERMIGGLSERQDGPNLRDSKGRREHETSDREDEQESQFQRPEEEEAAEKAADVLTSFKSASQESNLSSSKTEEGSRSEEENAEGTLEEQNVDQRNVTAQSSPCPAATQNNKRKQNEMTKETPSSKKRKADGIIAPQNDWEDDSLDSDEAIVRDMYRKEGFDVLFNPLSSSTSNVKLSFRIQNSQAVTIKELSEHIEKGLMLYINKRCSFKINEITTAQSKEGRLFFGGVVTIGMEMLEQNKKSQKASIRLFGFNNKDPEKRHKAQYSGQLSSNEDLFPLFRCLFEQQGRKIEDLQLSPNPVFSSTDNAVMDPSYGFDVDRMAKVLERLKEENKVEKYSKQLTGAINFNFFVEKGELKLCFSATVQKSGSIQLMLVKNPRRTRLETMRFLLTYCRDCIVSLESLKLNRRTLDKRNRARRELSAGKS